MIVAELSRISDHLLCNGAAGLDTGAFTFFLYAFYQREVLYDIFETLCGARFTNSYTRVGGLMHDMTPLVVEKIRAFIKNFPKTLDDMERLLNRNRIFIDRTKGVGVLTKEQAINRSATGPIARASGVARDLRKDEPYLCYPDFDFKVCCSTAGDCYARYLVRMAEMRESLRIVAQAIENLPPGPINVVDRRAHGAAEQTAGVLDDRGNDLALRAADDQSRLRNAARRNVRGDRVREWRAGLLSRRRRLRRGLSRPLPAAVVHSLCAVSGLDPRAHAERHRRGAGKFEHHRR